MSELLRSLLQLRLGSADLEQKSVSLLATIIARIDTSLFRQVLTNLVKNAVEANPGRNVEFVAELACTAQSITLTLVNNGVPVATGIAARMFDPYVSTKANKDNMGLGLAIVKKIIIEHGGEIEHRECGGHPAFTISLPRLSSATAAQRP